MTQKRKQKLRKKRKRCKSRGRIWRRGACYKKRRLLHKKVYTRLPNVVHNSLPDAQPKGRQISNEYRDWIQQIERNNIVQ